MIEIEHLFEGVDVIVVENGAVAKFVLVSEKARAAFEKALAEKRIKLSPLFEVPESDVEAMLEVAREAGLKKSMVFEEAS